MVYVYISMAAREGVLLLNGSRIRHWWLWHHYISALTCVITLTLPVDSPAVQRFVEGWLHWTVAQAALMLAQNQCAPACMHTPDNTATAELERSVALRMDPRMGAAGEAVHSGAALARATAEACVGCRITGAGGPCMRAQAECEEGGCRYQQKRMYARIALGKASSIDIIGGETSGMPGQLLALLPFLFLLQAWQLFMGANMMFHSGPAMIDPEGWLVRPPPLLDTIDSWMPLVSTRQLCHSVGSRHSLGWVH